MSEYITTKQAAEMLQTTDRTIRRRLSAMSTSRPHLVRYVRKQGKTIFVDIRLVWGNFERLEESNPDTLSDVADVSDTTETTDKNGIFPKVSDATDTLSDTTDTTEKQDSTGIVPILLQQIAEKDKQIEGLQKNIEGLQTNIGELIERNREQNIMLEKSHNERRLLLEQQPSTPTPIERNPSSATPQNIIIVLLALVLLAVVLLWLNSF